VVSWCSRAATPIKQASGSKDTVTAAPHASSSTTTGNKRNHSATMKTARSKQRGAALRRGNNSGKLFS
jgi:hypothetical protein